jgi:hypothetical protein
MYNNEVIMNMRLWTYCSCGHVAQDHDGQGKCLICFEGICVHCGEQNKECKGYDGWSYTIEGAFSYVKTKVEMLREEIKDRWKGARREGGKGGRGGDIRG